MEESSCLAAAYGGEGWRPRPLSLRDEMGTIWGNWGTESEWGPLEAVLLHRPGEEVEGQGDGNAALMLGEVNPAAMRAEHGALETAFRQAGVQVHSLDPAGPVPPNTMFCRDLYFMTPEGAILARPASIVRAGEERLMAQRLAELGVPILLSVHGEGVFEGADALWVDRETVLLSTGLRTNEAGADQVEGVLRWIGVDVVRVGLPYGAMHLLGTLNIAGPDLAVGWATRVPFGAVETLRKKGVRVIFLPHEEEASAGMALNFVALGPYRVLMPAGCPRTKAVYEAAGITCHEVEVGELRRAAGAIGCLTGILRRAPA